jgi:hypothetical protein
MRETLDHFVIPALGQLDREGITRSDIETRLLAPLLARGAHEQARRCNDVTRRVIEHAVDLELRQDNPAVKARKRCSAAMGLAMGVVRAERCCQCRLESAGTGPPSEGQLALAAPAGNGGRHGQLAIKEQIGAKPLQPLKRCRAVGRCLFPEQLQGAGAQELEGGCGMRKPWQA